MASVRNVTGDAVGIPRWYVAIVTHNTELAASKRLAALGHETYVASQPTLRIRSNGRKAMIDRVLISSHVFIRCTEAERRRIVTLPYIRRFLVDRTRAVDGLAAPPAIVPDAQLDTLRFMLGQSDHLISITTGHFRPGDKVRVIRGALRGLEGEVLPTSAGALRKGGDTESDPKTAPAEIIVRLDILGTARVSIPATDLTPA